MRDGIPFLLFCRGNGVLVALDLSVNVIGDIGARALAQLLRYTFHVNTIAPACAYYVGLCFCVLFIVWLGTQWQQYPVRAQLEWKSNQRRRRRCTRRSVGVRAPVLYI
jgi:hypothetical protein